MGARCGPGGWTATNIRSNAWGLKSCDGFSRAPATCSLQRLADSGKESAQFVSLIHRLEALPALRNMQPYTDVQLAKALVLARALFNYDGDSIPVDRKIRVRRLVVVAA